MSLYNAKKQFSENLRLFENAQTQPEKFNLYSGLVNLTDSLSEIESSVSQIRNMVEKIERNQKYNS